MTGESGRTVAGNVEEEYTPDIGCVITPPLNTAGWSVWGFQPRGRLATHRVVQVWLGCRDVCDLEIIRTETYFIRTFFVVAVVNHVLVDIRG